MCGDRKLQVYAQVSVFGWSCIADADDGRSSMSTMDGAATTGIPQRSADTPTGSVRKSFSHTCIHPHKYMQITEPAIGRPPPKRCEQGLSGCISMLHHISRDRDGGRGGSGTLWLLPGYMVAHRRPARVVVRPM